MRQIVKASGSIGIALLVVDALEDRAASFYQKYGWSVGLLTVCASLPASKTSRGPSLTEHRVAGRVVGVGGVF